MRLASREFTHADQMQFASASGDFNPMHVDALQARRTQAGAPVVHGIHMLLWALDSFAAAHPDLPPVRAFRAQFSKFVYLNERIDIEVTHYRQSSARLSLSVGGVSRSKLSIDFGEPSGVFPEWAAASLETLPLITEPLNLTFEETAGRSGRLHLKMTPEDAADIFPAATRTLGPQRIAAIAASTFLLGMVCPGLHSIYSELSASICCDSTQSDALSFRVTDTDPRFRSVDQEIAGAGINGEVKGFARNPPVEQATMASLKDLVAPQEFSGALALIIGGSRGLGELTAKLVATGGGRVVVTFQNGKNDADKVASEICSSGGECRTLSYDARKPAAEQLASLTDAPTHLYYFATPGIFRPQAEAFSAERLQDFLAVYVDGFWRLTKVLREKQTDISSFYPSTVFVEDRPRGMTEYAMAKAAGEVLCAEMNLTFAPMHITVSRLPRLPTDQTASITATETADPVETMLPLIRQVQAHP
jgi:NAD(P)-dependent dehydrogenase (short-subunit alcohol dehydrogenase family)